MVDLSALAGKQIFVAGATGLVGRAMVDDVLDFRNSKGVIDPLKHSTATKTADFIIHAAGYSAPEKFTADPIGTIKVNTETLIDLLERLKPGAKFLYISTSELYSGSWKEKHTEQDIGRSDPWHPRAAYIEGKRCGEAICAAYRRKGVDVKVARLALAYGPGTRAGDTRVMNKFIEQALTTGRIEMRDQGNAVRTYCYIDDVVEMLWNILLYGGGSTFNQVEHLHHSGIEPPVYNVGGFSQMTIRELAEMIGEETGASVSIPPNDYGLPGAPDHVSLDMAKYLREFGKGSWVDMRDGLKRTIAFQRGLYA